MWLRNTDHTAHTWLIKMPWPVRYLMRVSCESVIIVLALFFAAQQNTVCLFPWLGHAYSTTKTERIKIDIKRGMKISRNNLLHANSSRLVFFFYKRLELSQKFTGRHKTTKNDCSSKLSTCPLFCADACKNKNKINFRLTSAIQHLHCRIVPWCLLRRGAFAWEKEIGVL